LDASRLVARPIPGLVPVDDARAPLRVLIASLAPGGAERIVLEWLAAEIARGRDAELAVLHPRRHALAPPQGLRVRTRAGRSPESFLSRLAADWADAAAPISAHLITDDHLAILWDEGVRTVPTVHNHRDGWRNDPAGWDPRDVPAVVACAESVRGQLIDAGCRAPVFTVRHRPRVGARSCDMEARLATRASLRIAPDALLIGAIGAIKPQKDYARAVEVLAAVRRRREAALVILGGVLGDEGLAEIDRVMTRAVRLGVAAHLRLPGFVPAVDPWLAACDAVLNVSRFEGLSIAVQEALAAGLPVVATDVGGQGEIEHPGLERVAPHAGAKDVASRLGAHPVRVRLTPRPFARAPRAWSLPLGARAMKARRIDTLFVTANLNAGGAQRSLANLAHAIASRHRLAIAVCGETTQSAFVAGLSRAGVETFRPAPSADPFAVAESLLAHAQARGAAALCFWNADARVKLLVAKFALPGLRLVDASPGDYAFGEMDAAADFAASVATSASEYHARLDALIMKYAATRRPPLRHLAVIPNGVALLPPAPRSAIPRFLVSGRIAPSKRLEDVLAAFAQVRRSHYNAQLHVFGRVEERHAAYAASLALEAPGVSLRGESFDHAHFREAWTAAVVLGTHQGSPNAVLEAQAAGLAVIANDSGGTRETVADGKTGWLLREDAGASLLAEAMAHAARDLAAAAALGERGRELVRGSRTLEEMARRYLAVLAPESAPAHEKMGAWMPPPESPLSCASPASSR
jgi:glycosyltransferase involved in cell wall biosynthesis